MNDQPAREMPRYKCHKEVHALKIKKVSDEPLVAKKGVGGKEPHALDGAYIITVFEQMGGPGVS